MSSQDHFFLNILVNMFHNLSYCALFHLHLFLQLALDRSRTSLWGHKLEATFWASSSAQAASLALEGLIALVLMGHAGFTCRVAALVRDAA